MILLPTAGAWASLRLNEVLYDPDGADGGREFVELHNGGAAPVGLAGLRLQFANGAVGEVWEGRWTGGPADSIPAGGFFLVVDQGWQGVQPDAVASLGLQNGPDALRLLREGEVLDLLGYGDLSWPALYEGLPHPGATGGGALARRPDGHDTDRNDLDWHVPGEPTPGASNYPAFGLEITTYAAEPPSLVAPGDTVVIGVGYRASGLVALPAAEVSLHDGAGDALAAVPCGRLEPGAQGRIEFRWQPSVRGISELRLSWPLGRPGERLEAVVGRYFCDLPSLVLTEVMAAPASDACEWIELLVSGDASVELGDHALRDADGASRALPPRLLAPGERVVIVQSAEIFADWCLGLQGSGAWPCPPVAPRFFAEECPGAWPTLNNTPPADRDYADRVHLLAGDGTVLDHATVGWAGAEVTTGRSLERSGLLPAGHGLRLWRASTAAVGATPGCENALEAAGTTGAALNVALAGDGEGVIITFQLHVSEISWRLEIYDLTGYCLRDLGGDDLGAGPRRIAWDGRDDRGRKIAQEALIALLTVRGADDARLRRHKALIVAGDGP